MKKQIQLIAIWCLALVSFSSCDMLNMPNKMDDMKTQTHDDMTSMKEQTHNDMEDMKDQTNDGLRLNKIAVALQNIFLDSNTEYFLPVPADMMPWAQVLADNLHEDEFVKLMDVWQRRITQIAASCSDVNGSVTGADGKCTLSPDLIAKTDHEKQAHFWGIAAVSGLMSQDMIAQTIQTEYTQGGQFNETLYAILATRQVFIQTVLMDNTLMEKDVDDPGKLKKAVEYAEDLQYINDLSFANLIDFNMSEMFNPNDVADVKFDPTVAKTEWQNINTAFQTELKPQYKTEMQDSKSEEGQELVSLQNEVLSHLAPPPSSKK